MRRPSGGGREIHAPRRQAGRPSPARGNANPLLGSLTDLQGPTPGRVPEDLAEGVDHLERESETLARGGAQLLIAEALLNSGDGSGAVTWARQARATYLAIPQSPAAVRCLLIEGRARHMDRDPAAEPLFRGALRECQALLPVPSLLEAEIACELILYLGEEARWAAARSVYNQVRPSRVLAPPLSPALVNFLTRNQTSRSGDRTRAPRSAARVMALYVLAQCQAQIATMAADLCFQPFKRGDDVAA